MVSLTDSKVSSSSLAGNTRSSPGVEVVIVRDRPSSGGGIHNYYTAVAPHLQNGAVFCDVGKPFSFYGDHRNAWSWLLQFTPTRLFLDWLSLALKIVRHWPKVVLVNACLDPLTFRSLRRDAVNVLIGKLFRRRVIVFWRGWENDFCGSPQFPGGNSSWICRFYKCAGAQVVLAGRFKDDLIRWGFDSPIHLETTVVGEEFTSVQPRTVSYTARRTNLLFLSRVEVPKGAFELIDAYQILKASDSTYTLTIAGDGPDLQALRDHVAQTGLSDVVFTGFVTGEAKLRCYQEASIFCFLSYTEGMPNAVLEAMAMGLPLISSDAGGLQDILADGVTGFIVHPKPEAPVRRKFDPSEVAGRIARIAQDRELYQQICIHNHAYARERFSAKNVARRLEAICSAVSVNLP